MLRGIGTDSAQMLAQERVKDNRLKETCGEFESLFLNYMLKASRSTVPGGSYFGDSQEGEIIKSMFDENLSRVIAGSGGIGMGQLLYEQLRETIL